MGMAERAERLKGLRPDLVADIKLYSGPDGRRSPVMPGYGCLCVVSKETPLCGYDVLLHLDDEPLDPGAQRRVGMVFLTAEGAERVRGAPVFYLWEGRFIGEGSPVAEDASPFSERKSTSSESTDRTSK